MARPKLDTPNYRLTRRGRVYYVRWWQDGAWRRVSTGEADRGSATRWLHQFAAGRGTPDPPDAPTVAMILAAYLADRKPVVRCYERMEMAAKAITRHLGDLQPEHLTKERTRFYARRRRAEGHMVGPDDARRKKTITDGTVIRELGVLRNSLLFAKREGWIPEAPHIERPPQPPPRLRFLTRDEAKRLIDSAASLHAEVFLALCLYTAGRNAAIRELTWDRVDFDAGLIDLGMAPGGKTRAVVPIAAALLPRLEKARDAATCDYVVEYAGAPVGSLKRATRAAAVRAGLPGVTPHVLRHTAATWLAMAGRPMEEIARLLGHKDPRTTWTVYAKHTPDYLRGAIAALSG